ncbi:MAG: alpha/beta fold hydrolase [Dehalococcoidales bacterium]|nr:alpha/beta fold hydrolase [Dehalococcoidales bacterium]
MEVKKIATERTELLKTEYEDYVTVEGMRLHYVACGVGSPLLLLHGFSEFSGTWELNLPFLSNYYRVYAIDLPGHGLSDKPEVSYQISFFTESVIGFMQALGISRASLIAHSFGGAVAIKVAVDSPEKVARLILETSFGLSDDVSLLHRLCTVPVFSDTDITESEVESALEHRMRMEFYNPDLAAKEMVNRSYQFMMIPEMKRVSLSILRSWIGGEGLRPEVMMLGRLHQIKSPTLLVHGVQDNIHPVELSRQAAKLIPGAKLKIFDKCGHCPHIEKAAEFNYVVRAFLAAN